MFNSLCIQPLFKISWQFIPTLTKLVDSDQWCNEILLGGLCLGEFKNEVFYLHYHSQSSSKNKLQFTMKAVSRSDRICFSITHIFLDIIFFSNPLIKRVIAKSLFILHCLSSKYRCTQNTRLIIFISEIEHSKVCNLCTS